MSSNEWMPAQIPFDLVRRGYAPDQVTAHLERLEYDLRIATANSDATNQRLSEVTAQLSHAQSEVDHLRAQLDQMAREPVSMAGLSNRMERMIRLAEDEAAEIRARANSDAEQVRGSAAAIAARTNSEREAFDSERERTRRQMAEQVDQLVSEARTDAENTRAAANRDAHNMVSAAAAEADRLVTSARTEAEATLGSARAEADSTLTAARTEATNTLQSARTEAEQTVTAARSESASTLGAARAEAERLVSTARAEAESLTAAADAERQRLDSEGAAYRKQVAEDFEIAIAARRNEAHQRLTEREELSVADAKQRVAEAQAEAERLVAEATARSADLIRRAAAESHQRVAEADQAIDQLSDLRGRILGQLTDLRGHLGRIDELVGTAPAIIEPPAQEQGRPVTADFPQDPAARPTGLPEDFDSADGSAPWNQVTVDGLRAEDGDQPQTTAPAATGSGRPAEASLPAVGTPADSEATDTFAAVTEEHLSSTASELPRQQGKDARRDSTARAGRR